MPPFAAVQLVDWWRKRGDMDVRGVLTSALKPGRAALVALVAGFAAATPFMDTCDAAVARWRAPAGGTA